MCAEEEVYICEPEQGSVFSESSDEDEDMRLDDGFMDPWKDENLLEEMMFETTNEDQVRNMLGSHLELSHK